MHYTCTASYNSNSAAVRPKTSAVGSPAHQSYNMSSQPQPSPKQADHPPAPQSSNSTKEEETNTTTNPTNSRLTSLQTKLSTLHQSLTDLKTQRHTLATQTRLPSGLALPTTAPSGETLPEDEILASALKSSNAVVKSHIALLHKYNEIKDIGQGLMGLIADKRDCRVVGVMEEFGVGEGD